MSWLARSLANSLRFDDDDDGGDGDDYDDDDNDVEPNRPCDPPTASPETREYRHRQQQQPHQPQYDEVESDNEALARGVKEDLDEFKQTLTRQFWGMASFLAPPPTNSYRSSTSEHHSRSDPDEFTGNQSEPSDQCASEHSEEAEAPDDAAIYRTRRQEIERRFRDESPEISGMDPNLILFGSESVDYEESEMEQCDLKSAIGITEEVLAFARNITMHPETWIDFPIDEEEDTDDFDMSDAQLEHALVIERLAPRLAALRIELCPCHMSEDYFWKVYFVLLHSRLNKQDAEVLSTPQVMAARSMWMQELHKQMKPESERFQRSTSYMSDTAQHEDFAPSILDHSMPHVTRGYERTTWPTIADYEIEKHTIETSETLFVDKSVIEEKPILKTEDKGMRNVQSSKIVLPDYEDDEEEWPEEDSDLGVTSIPGVNDEDISFSDLEDDDYGIKPVKSITDTKKV